MPDFHKNFAYSTVAVAPTPAVSGSSLTVGNGSLFPAPPFNVTVWPIGAMPLSTNAEIVRVTAIVGNVFTILRSQEGSNARAIIVGDQIAETITAKALTDIENQNVVNETPVGLIDGVNDTYTSAFNFRAGSVSLYINGLREYHYTTMAANMIIIDDPPLTGYLLKIDYIKT
jgi:hypothetical protein